MQKMDFTKTKSLGPGQPAQTAQPDLGRYFFQKHLASFTQCMTHLYIGLPTLQVLEVHF